MLSSLKRMFSSSSLNKFCNPCIILFDLLFLTYPLSLPALIGYRTDNLSWNIADVGGHPIVRSELEYRDLKSIVFDVKGGLSLPQNFRIDFWGDIGTIVAGTCQDSDFEGDERTILSSKSISQAGKGTVFDATLGLGRCYPSAFGKITPLLGYSIHGQLLELYDGFQLVPFVGPIEGLNSHYKTLWQSAWCGFEHIICLSTWVEGFLRAEVHYAFYSARGLWNLNEKFGGEFKHQSQGIGGVLFCGARLKLTRHLGLGASILLQGFRTCGGTSSVPLLSEGANGTVIRSATQRLNAVIWQSSALFLDLSYSF